MFHIIFNFYKIISFISNKKIDYIEWKVSGPPTTTLSLN